MAACNTVSLTMPAADIAALVFDAPGKSVNLLSRSVLAELETQLDELARRD